eukprot:gnl/Trimastix_PCT/1995.p1 GENE.gnl/Trimastix_PCT/1995~~gnl/Trimastix_PCT/1995.p1  ORF type:complete len:199 (-),score=19.15 gnl/Trimastix_PCT/1995:43-579(-)
MNKKSKKKSIIICGLNNAGKTSLCHRMKALIDDDSTEEVLDTAPTIGIDTLTLSIGGTPFDILDMSGQKAFRFHWQQYNKQANLIVFVVDASDMGQIEEASRTLREYILAERELKEIPLLVIGNKNDLPGALMVDDIIRYLQRDLHDRSYHILSTSAKTGRGVREVMEWFLQPNMPFR